LSRGRRWLIIAVTALMLALPASALAGNPAQNQYKLPPVSATGSDDGGQGDGRLNAPAATTTGSGSNAATIAILAGGVVAIGGAAGLILYRRRRAQSGEST